MSGYLLRAFALLGFVVLMITVIPLDSWWAGQLAGLWNDPKGDVLIVLGGSVGPGAMIGESSYLRCEYAILAYEEGGFRTIVVSGGGTPTPVAMAMRDFLKGEGIPPAAILTETRSTNTRENAVYTKDILNHLPGKKVLLTSDFHMFRAYRTFRKVGIEVLPRPIPDVRKRAATWRGRWPAFLELVEETIKIGYYCYRGWI